MPLQAIHSTTPNCSHRSRSMHYSSRWQLSRGRNGCLSPPNLHRGRLCREAEERLFSSGATGQVAATCLNIDDIPDSLPIRTQGLLSTQQVLGQLLMSISRVPQLSQRVVTASPDVSTSTESVGLDRQDWHLSTRGKRRDVFARRAIDRMEGRAQRPTYRTGHI